VVSWYTGLTFRGFVMTATVEGLQHCPNPEGAPVFYVELRGPLSNNVWGYEFGSDVYTLQINKHNETSSYNLASLHTKQLAAYGAPMQIKVQVQGSSLQYWLTDQNGVTYHLSAQDSEFAVGYIGVATYNCGVEFTNIVVSSLLDSTTTTSATTASTPVSTATAASTATTTSTTPALTTTTETCQVAATESDGRIIGAQLGSCTWI
jgi:hypothetical protein